MDERSESDSADSVGGGSCARQNGAVIAVTGLDRCVIGESDSTCDPLPWLRVKKLRKFMSIQDDLSVIAASRAVATTKLNADVLRERTALHWTSGYVPFERPDLERLAESAGIDGRLSMDRFSTAGFRSFNGLLTFQCLPNMPAFHITVALDLQGPYFVTYPGPGQLYVALEQATHTLRAGDVDAVLLGGGASQQNALVQHHFQRLEHPPPQAALCDGAGCMVLERLEDAQTRGAVVIATLEELQVEYTPFDPFEQEPEFCEETVNDGSKQLVADSNPASLPIALSRSVGGVSGRLSHSVRSRDGIHGHSTWKLM